MSRLRRLIVEIHRRSLWQVLLVYCGGAWVCYEIIDTITDRLVLPEWLPVLAIILFLVGLPVVLATALVRERGSVAHEPPVEEPGSAAEGPEERHAARPELRGDGGESSVLVFPFEDLSPGGDCGYLGEGLADELIGRLSKLEKLRVIGRSSSLRAKELGFQEERILEELRARYLVEGSVRRSGDNLRISAQVSDLIGASLLWAETFSGSMGEIFVFQEQVSHAVAQALDLRLTEEDEAALEDAPIPDVLAYDHYLRARHDIMDMSEAGVSRALDHLQKALELTGKNGVILRGIGLAKYQLVNIGAVPAEAALSEIEEIAEEIEALDPSEAHVPFLRGLVAEQRGDARECVRQLRLAYSRDPTDPDTCIFLSVLSFATGQVEFGRHLAARLRIIEPLTHFPNLLEAYGAFFAGEPESRLSTLRRGVETGRDVPTLLWAAVRIMVAAGRTDEAEEIAKILCEEHPDSNFTVLSTAFLSALKDDTSKPDRRLPSELEDWTGQVAEWAQFVADYYAVCGDTDRAFQWLTRAMEVGFLNTDFIESGDSCLEPLRSDPRFPQLVKRMRQGQLELERTLPPVELAG